MWGEIPLPLLYTQNGHASMTGSISVCFRPRMRPEVAPFFGITFALLYSRNLYSITVNFSQDTNPRGSNLS